MRKLGSEEMIRLLKTNTGMMGDIMECQSLDIYISWKELPAKKDKPIG